MTLSETLIRRVLEDYDLGELQSVIRLEDGYFSDNYALTTDRGVYAFRILYDSEENISYTLRLYEYLVSHGIKTARPVRTVDNRLYLRHGHDLYCIQTFIEGERGKRERPFFPIVGRELGRVQAVLAKATFEGREKDGCLIALRRLVPGMPSDGYVQGQYAELQKELASLPLERFTQSIVNGDCDPEDFFFKDGRFTGILDFGAAHPDYVLYDVASTMMYCSIYQKECKADFLRFIWPYLQEFHLPKEEFEGLHAFLKARFLEQVTYHWWRYQEGVAQAVGTADANLQGVEDGKKMLRILAKVPEDFYARTLD